MTVHTRHLMPILIALAALPAQAEIFKCREGSRITYQERPCPVGSQSASALEPQPQPSSYEVEQARARARNEIQEAEALRKRDGQATQAQEKKRAAASKQERTCERLRQKIARAEDNQALTKTQKKALKSERREYQKECGPL